jgi:hypothetical protein
MPAGGRPVTCRQDPSGGEPERDVGCPEADHAVEQARPRGQ